MIRWAGRHPLLAHAAAGAPQLAALIAGYHALTWSIRARMSDPGLHNPVFGAYFLVLPAAMVLVPGFVLTLYRRWAGQSVWPLFLLLLLSPLQTLVCWFGVYTYAVLILRQRSIQDWLEDLLRWRGFWADGFVAGSAGVAALASLVAVLAGLVVARHKLRTGRWETIGPVDRPET